MRPEGYYHARHDDGTLTISSNDPGLGAARIHWRPVGTFEEDEELEFRVPLAVIEEVFEQYVYDRNMRHAKAEAAADVAKVKANVKGKAPDVRREETVQAGSPEF